jgi:hypothetical protein
VVAVLAERVQSECARSMRAVATTQASIPGSFYFPKSGLGSGGGRGEGSGK